MRRDHPEAWKKAVTESSSYHISGERRAALTARSPRRLASLTLLAILVVGGLQACAVEGYRVIRRKKPKVRMGPKTRVVLFGVDRKAAHRAPAVCKTLGEVEAWSLGKKTFPYTSFRRAARALGGNGVSGIRSTGRRKNRYYRRGLVVLCPVLPPPPPGHAVP